MSCLCRTRSGLNRVHPVILRPLLVLLTLGMLVFAVLQMSGRLVFSLLDDLELTANQWLSAQQIQLTGLQGSWRGLNPVVRIDQIDLPAGQLRGVYLELDWMESMLRNRPVARRIVVESGHIMLERGEAGWRLAGGLVEADFDPLDTLYYSDALEVTLRVGFRTGGGANAGADQFGQRIDELDVSYRATNTAGAHRHRLTLTNIGQECRRPCSARLGMDIAESIPFVRQRAETVFADVEDFTVPGSLLGSSPGKESASGSGSVMINRLAAHWWRRDELSAGNMAVEFDEFALSADRVLSGQFELVSRGEQGVHSAELHDVRLSSGARELVLPNGWISFEAGVAQLWMAQLDVGAGASFFADALPADTVAGRWLQAIDLQATAMNVRSYLRVSTGEVGFAATVRDVSLEAYRGSPWIRGGAGEVLGHRHGMLAQVNASELDVHFPGIFHQNWQMRDMQGVLQAWFTGEYFALAGNNLRGVLDGNRISGGFSVSRPKVHVPEDKYQERLALLLNIDQISVANIKRYIPYRLPVGLPEWLERGPKSGELSDVVLAYQGQVHTIPFELARRVEFTGRIDNGHVQYHPDWPELLGLHGTIAVAGREVRIVAEQGRSLAGADISGSRILLGNNAAYADIDLQSDATVAQALEFVRSTPLARWMSFITPDWSGAGDLKLEGFMHIPLKLGSEHIGDISAEKELAVDLQIGLDRVDLNLPAYRVSLGQLTGQMAYVYPHGISGEGVSGRIFDRPAIFAAASDADTVIFHVNGSAPYESVLEMFEMFDPGVMRGAFDFLAELHVEFAESTTHLDVVSDLTGLALDLPGEFTKLPDDSVDTEFQISFLEDYQELNFVYGEARGRLHVDDSLRRGAIGFSVPTPRIDNSVDELLLTGRVEGFTLDEVVPDAADGPGGDAEGSEIVIPIRVSDLNIGLFDVNGIGFIDVVVDGTIDQGQIALHVEGESLQGDLQVTGDEPLQLNLERLLLPGSGGDSQSDPLSVSVANELVSADVDIRQFRVGESDYGSWMFKLRPDDQGIAFKDLTAQLRGVTIQADEVYWNTQLNETSFDGTMTATNLAEVLPQWGYAASISTESADLSGALKWRGSPAMVDIDRFVGKLEFSAENGRFLEVESGAGAMRIFSLVNFSTLAKRLNFDFSDVVGDGISFNTLTATASLDEGMLQFVEPMLVDGSGSIFKIAGKVNLIDGLLDNEMIVTLPVSRSLPWYAAYIALANPLAGLGVLVGERVLRKPIEQFSSAKYRITGTLEEPQVKFVGVWDTRVDEPADTEAADEAEDGMDTEDQDPEQKHELSGSKKTG